MDAQGGILSYYLCDNSSSPSSGSVSSFSNAIGAAEESIAAASSNISGTPRWQVNYISFLMNVRRERKNNE